MGRPTERKRIGTAALSLVGVAVAILVTATPSPAALDLPREKTQLQAVFPVGGESLSRTVQWQVAVARGTVKKVSFWVDGVLLGTDAKKPFAIPVDTTKLSDGQHRLLAAPNGSLGQAITILVTVSNHPGPGPQKQLYWGAWIDSHLTGSQPPWDMSAVTQFEHLAGKGMSLIQFSTPFYSCSASPCSPYDFPGSMFERIRDHGSIPFFSWISASTPVSKSEPDFQLRDIADGSYDEYISRWASAAKAWGHPFFLRFDWEMNGDWFPWGESVNGNGQGDFVAAWRHVHDIFTAVGADKVTWVWCPSVDASRKYTPLAELYPGDAYVDWTCLDGYNWNYPWLTFDDVFKSSYADVAAVAPSKPMVIGETASTEKGGSKAAWVADALTELTVGYPKIKGLLWAEFIDDGWDWPIESSESAQAAFALGIGTPAFAANSFGSLDGGPIAPLT